MGNYVKIFGLMAVMTALIVGVAYAFGGPQAMLPAFIIMALFNFGSYWFSDKAVLKMYRARIIEPHEHPELYAMVDRLRQRAGLPMPRIGISDADQPNAFATGRDYKNAVVCYTQGILSSLSKEELEGVTAHELAHIKNRDMLTSTLAATMAGAVMFLSRFAIFFGGKDRNPVSLIAMMILGPLAALIVQMAVSRQMEYRADRVGAQISGDPRALARALMTLEGTARRIPLRVNPSAANLAIVNPLRGGISALFRTHPPTEERVARLESLARTI